MILARLLQLSRTRTKIRPRQKVPRTPAKRNKSRGVHLLSNARTHFSIEIVLTLAEACGSFPCLYPFSSPLSPSPPSLGLAQSFDDKGKRTRASATLGRPAIPMLLLGSSSTLLLVGTFK